MQRNLPLHALFSALLLACGSTDGDDDSGSTSGSDGSSTSPNASDPSMATDDTDTTTSDTEVASDDTTTTTGGCEPVIDGSPVDVPAEDVDPLLDRNGQIMQDACEDLCSSISADIVGCELLDVPGGGTTSDATTTGGDATSTGADTDGTVQVLCQFMDCAGGTGRGHAALQRGPEACGDEVVGVLAARMAHEESGSVVAFEVLADELEAASAPASLIARAREAARDEVVHARMLGRIARDRGVEPTEPTLGPVAARSLEAIAIENAIEGCVRETWGALLASYQARHAQDASVRAAMQQIAVDETRHAELSRDLDLWLTTQLSPAANGRVEQARRSAVAQVLEHLRTAAPEPAANAVGLPPRAAAVRLFSDLRTALWA